MGDPAFKREPIRSRKYLNGARDQRCTFQIPNVCTYNVEETVACHIRDETQGRSVKADDISTADGCRACHDLMDGRTGQLSREDWLFYALRGLQRTMRRRFFQGLLVVTRDKPKPSQVLKKRPKGNSRPIPKSQNAWPKGRKLATRPLRRKEST